MSECILVLDNIRSVANVGSIFRTADCLGVSKIILVGTTPTPIDRFGRKRKDFIKVSLGAENFVPWEYTTEVRPLLNRLKKEGYKVIALEQDKKSIKLKNSSTSQVDKFVFIVGNEVDGIPRSLLGKCNEIIEIPMRGQKESMNVSVATGIALFNLI